MLKLLQVPVSFIRKILSKKKNKNPNLPYSDSRRGNKEKNVASGNFDPRKTQIGVQTDFSSDNMQNKNMQNDIESCPKCQYPLRTKPDISSPCPNCGYTGNHIKTVFDSGKTISISSLNQDAEKLQEFKFKLFKEDDNSVIEIQSPDEPEVILNRSHLDPANSTISGEQHVILKFRNRKIYIEDVSSTGSSFLQARNKVMIGDGTRLVMGNKIYVFNQSGTITQGNPPNKTRNIGEFELNAGQPGSGFSLTDEIGGKKQSFDKIYIVLNRSILDPGNNSISSTKHSEFEFNNGQWYIRDLSSNESTFVQIKGEQLLENKIRIILGNKIFRFEYV